MDEIDSGKRQLEAALHAILRADMIAHRADPAEAVQAILTYVFHDQTSAPDAMRYEMFYSRRSLALAIAEGWRMNHLDALAPDESIAESIRRYVSSTYGSNFTDYP